VLRKQSFWFLGGVRFRFLHMRYNTKSLEATLHFLIPLLFIQPIFLLNSLNSSGSEVLFSSAAVDLRSDSAAPFTLSIQRRVPHLWSTVIWMRPVILSRVRAAPSTSWRPVRESVWAVRVKAVLQSRRVIAVIELGRLRWDFSVQN